MCFNCFLSKRCIFHCSCKSLHHDISWKVRLVKQESVLWFVISPCAFLYDLVGPVRSSLHSRLFFDPPTEFGDPWVDARFVPARAAIAPTDHSCQKHATAGRTGQRAARIPLTETKTGTCESYYIGQCGAFSFFSTFFAFSSSTSSFSASQKCVFHALVTNSMNLPNITLFDHLQYNWQQLHF